MTEPPDAFAQDAIGTADVARRLRGDGGRLEAETRDAHGGRGLADNAVGRGPPVPQGEIEAQQLQIEPEHDGVQHTQRLFEQLLPGLVPVTHDDLAPG